MFLLEKHLDRDNNKYYPSTVPVRHEQGIKELVLKTTILKFGEHPMPEFLDLYIQDLYSKAKQIIEAYSLIAQQHIAEYISKEFYEYWITIKLPKTTPDKFNVLAVDSSSRHYITSNSGIFYVARALAITNNAECRKVFTMFDYDPTEKYSEITGRIMEWLEHEAILEALNNGFEGYVLIDGSIYGRIAHVPLETSLTYHRGFMIKYFETLVKLLKTARRKKVVLIGISKESRTSFFRKYLIRKAILKLAKEYGIEESEIKKLLDKIAEGKGEARLALRKAEELPENLRELIREYVSNKTDFQLIMNYAKTPGYTTPLLLAPPMRTKRALNLIRVDPEEYLKSSHPISSLNKDFASKALKVIEELPNLPGIVSFHILPSTIDTPMRIDVPSWTLNIERKLSEINSTEKVNVDVRNILEVIAAGYSGLKNYNIWLTMVDRKVKLSRDVFEKIYLPKFEELVGRKATSRGYRRVRFP